MSSTTLGRKETERTKLIQEKCQTLLTQMLRDEDNKYCVDCDAKGPRWASWNLGVFLCIRCAGIHRNLGVHISRVKSVNLDTWTPEQVISLQQMGNSRARAVYEAQLPDGFRRPQTDTALESFIRAKYEHKKYLAREWVPPSPPKVDWVKEIDEELERQKRKKKAAQLNSALAMNTASDKKLINSSLTITPVKSTPLPAPLPKPKPNQAGGSPKTTQRVSTNSTSGTESDLLGLSSPTKPLHNGGISGSSGNIFISSDLNNDSFSSFLSATTTTNPSTNMPNANGKTADGETNQAASNVQNALAKEEQDFFNQTSLCGGSDKDKNGKLSKDSILALYGTQATHSPQINFGGFTGMAPGYMQSQQQQHPQQQFMTPPNSVSMYNAPVMTAPNAFTTPAMNMSAGTTPGFGFTGVAMGISGSVAQHSVGATSSAGANLNLIPTNQNLLSGMSLFGSVPNTNVATMINSQSQYMGLANMGIVMNTMQQQQQEQQQQQQLQQSYLTSLGGGLTNSVGTAFPTPNVGAAATANLNQQFGNLNIGNVWQ